jgi:hypothetical protein
MENSEKVITLDFFKSDIQMSKYFYIFNKIIDVSENKNVSKEFLLKIKDAFITAKGSSNNHQNFHGGYVEHVYQCLLNVGFIIDNLNEIYSITKIKVLEKSANKVILFHDFEKIWKYSDISYQNLFPTEMVNSFLHGKKDLYEKILPKYGISFNEEELIALKNIHGEIDYSENHRSMNELGAICHSAEILSSRFSHSLIKFI